MTDPPRLTRRRLLLLLGGAGLAAGSGAGVLAGVMRNGADAPAPAPSPAPAPAPAPTPTTDRPSRAPAEQPTAADEPVEAATPEITPEPAEPYAPVAGEVYTDAKLVAATMAQALLTYRTAESLAAIVERSLVQARSGLDVGAVAEAAAPLHDPGSDSVGEVVYPQLGGLAPAEEPQAASVMVVARQQLTGDRGERAITRTLDIRLVVEDGRWAVDALADAGGEEIARPDDLAPEAVAVLEDERIELPDSARWDIHEGIVDPRLLTTLSAMAADVPFAVTSLRNGHPVHVFGTDRVSNHTEGRGADIWRVGDEAVVSQQPDEGTPAWELNHRLFADGEVPELGGPWAFDGFGGRSFTNEVHLDHLHVAFYASD
jgi:hypothetical protein